MIELSLAEITSAVGGQPAALPELRVGAVSTDSRMLQSGSLFVALRGESGDGHDWVDAAVAAGAAAVMVEREVAVPAQVGAVIVPDCWRALLALAGHVRAQVDPDVIAITGSLGKTTTKDLTSAAVASERRTVAATGSFNNELGVPLTLLALTYQTQALVTEIGARHPGDIAHLTSFVAPDVAVVTSVAPVHLEIFGSIEAVAATKGELVADLGEEATAVLNADDPLVLAMAKRTAARVLTFGLSAAADVRLLDVVLDERAHPTAGLETPWGNVGLTVPVAGRHNAHNAAAAVAAAGSIGVDPQAAAAGIAGAAVSKWRGEVVDVGGIRFLNDAYNANPVAMRAALATLDELAMGRRVAVLGVMAEIGKGHDAEHHAVGADVPNHADVLVVVGEDATGIAIGAEDAGMAVQHVHMVADLEAAASVLREVLERGDTVLVKASRVAGLERIVADWKDEAVDVA
jgi:UDP-N-acetylmuramoyl-tripeptide--D-alanyl-D-alanine ligase